tara:strand:+ start:21487 stop:22107 length:621 start_codon:yes stop_codon:yes gene_type:complete
MKKFKDIELDELPNISFSWDMIDDNMHQLLEFGVATGASLNHNTRLIYDYNPGQLFDVHGFDTFTGLPEDWVTSDGKIILPKGSFGQQEKFPLLDPELVERDNISFWVGLFEDTLPKYLATSPGKIAFLHIDCDLYSSTRTVLYGLNNLIVPGTIIRFDEWVYWGDEEFDDHEARCFHEWVEDFGREYRFFKQSGDIEEKFVLITG